MRFLKFALMCSFRDGLSCHLLSTSQNVRACSIAYCPQVFWCRCNHAYHIGKCEDCSCQTFVAARTEKQYEESDQGNETKDERVSPWEKTFIQNEREDKKFPPWEDQDSRATKALL